jgi:hypothetical protein
MEKYIWGLDISTTNIGFSLFSDKGKLIELKHLELKIDKNTPIEDRIMIKSDIFCKYIQEYKEHVLNVLNGEITQIVVEEPLGGSVNQNTVAMLLGFNGICCYILYKIFNIIPKKISVYNSRKLFCNELITITHKKNKKTGIIEKKETLSFPKEYLDKKKLYIWEKVAKLQPEIVWFYDKNNKLRDNNFDMSDSFTVTYAYLKQIGIIK